MKELAFRGDHNLWFPKPPSKESSDRLGFFGWRKMLLRLRLCSWVKAILNLSVREERFAENMAYHKLFD